MGIILTLFKGDIKNIKRDIILMATIIGPIAMALLLRLAVPIASDLLLKQLGFKLTPYYPLIVGIALMLIPMLIGTMTGFLLLEDKDEKMLMYFSVTPLSKEGYLAYRILNPVILNMVLSLFLVYFSNLITINIIKLVPVILMASIEAILIALVLGAFGENRVDGLAMSKALGVFFIVPVIDKLIFFKYNILLGIFPTYWVPKAIENSCSNINYMLFTAIGFVVHLVYVFILYNEFSKRQ
jgi:fluoroquinolone transport system permease protein